VAALEHAVENLKGISKVMAVALSLLAARNAVISLWEALWNRALRQLRQLGEVARNAPRLVAGEGRADLPNC
jgi:hypothetical protein